MLHAEVRWKKVQLRYTDDRGHQDDTGTDFS